MSSHTCRRFACLLLLTGILSLVLTTPARAVVYSFGRHPDKERLVLDFKGKIPRYSVSRTGMRELTLSVPPNALGAPGRIPDLGGARFVSSVRKVGGDILVSLNSSAFGYVAFALDEQGKVVLDVFADPLGRRWKPRGAPAAKPLVAAADAAAARPAKPEPVAPEALRPGAPASGQTAPAIANPAVARPDVLASGIAPGVAPAPLVADAGISEISEDAAPVDARASAAPSVPAMRAPVVSPGDRASARRAKSAVRLPHVFRGRVLRPGEKTPAEGFEIAQGGDVPAPPSAASSAVSPASGIVASSASGGAAQRTPAAPVERDTPPASAVRRSISPPGTAPTAPDQDSAPTQVENGAEAPAAVSASSTPAASSSAAGVSTQQEIVKRMVQNLLEGRTGSKFRGAVQKPDEALRDVRQRLDAAGSGPMEGEPDIQPADASLPQPDAVPAEDAAADETTVADTAADAAPDAAAVADGEPGDEEPTAAEAARLEMMQDIMFAAQSAQGGGDHDTALKELATLLAQPDVPEAMREEAMYTKADILYAKYRGELEDHFDEINGGYEAAINFNLDSWRVPAALLRRGVINLKVGNIPEAEAYFRILRDKFKGDPNVPLSYYYWGDHYYREGDFQKAADEFQYLVQVFPDSKFVREASIGLARALRKLGYDKQAFQIVDYIEKRWPRFYVEFPPFLRLLGDAAYAVEDFEKAKGDYWTYYNIDPDGDEADIILAKLGDIYIRTGRDLAARELYDKALMDFPDREGGLIAKMRLAEEGIYDEPTVEQMFSIFDRPLNLKPAQIYKQIVDEHGDSPLAPLAQLKTAMWHLWNNKFVDSMAAAEEFGQRFPNSELADRAKSVGVKAFGSIVDQLIGDENYPKIVSLWEKHEFVREKGAELAPSAKLALALAFWKRGLPGTALEVVMPFMQEEQIPEYSEMAMSLALSVFVENQAWERVMEVAAAVDEWEIAPQYRRELVYAQALALENLGRFDESRPLWTELGQDRELGEEQRAYAIFFLARDALADKQFRKAYDYAQDAYEILVRADKDQAKIRESLAILMDVTERSGRYREAIKWASLYRDRLPAGDQGRPALDYRIAGMYRRGGDTAKWRGLLKEIADSGAGTLYGRMAASDLEMESLDRAAREYVPQSQY